jgi:hypothetical protein
LKDQGLASIGIVMRGLDLRIHPLRKKMDGRVEPGHDVVLVVIAPA